MRIIYADDNLTIKNSVVVLGNFDGVHKAHKMLIEKAIRIAKENGFLSVIYTFSVHPQKYFGKSVELLTTNEEKERIFADMGVDILVYQKPDREFLSISPDLFVKNVVAERLGAKCVVVGQHYTFGARAKGTSGCLKDLAEQCGIKTYIEELLELDGEIISSSGIRNLIKNGEIIRANKMLGRTFSVTGTVVHGNHLGTGIGFPTANINFDTDKIVPEYGVYIGKAIVNNKEYHSLINIGIKPTVGGNTPLLEAHLLDANSDFYGQKITFELFDFTRKERKFGGLDQLKEQINLDLQKAKEYFK